MTVTIRKGDCREVLKTLPDQSVHCVVTSPPYWGLRDYGTAQWEGGDAVCSHIAPATGSTQNKANNGKNGTPFREICGICGARRIDSQIGLERSLGEYIETMVGVFREVKRVLRDDGTLWLNMGDCYAASQYGSGGTDNPYAEKLKIKGSENYKAFEPRKLDHGLKQKDLVGAPWRLAFALQADGWWLRQDIIWAKPNPMPESVTDRCTKAHEYIFLLSKSARYYYDAEAIAESFADERNGNPGIYHRTPQKSKGANRDRQDTGFLGNGGGWNSNAEKASRNKRSVWEIATAPFSEAHFATFPPALIEPCIKAGCPKGGTVLDPFGGAGTTGLVADRLGRDALLIELNPEYIGIAERRLSNDAGMFSNVELG